MYSLVGESFTLEGVVLGGDGGVYTYTWYRNGLSFKTGEATEGSTIPLTDVMDKSLTGSKGYVAYQLRVEDAYGCYDLSADIHVYPHEKIYFDSALESQECQKPINEYDRPIETFYVDVRGGNPAYINYQWQYSLDKKNWIDITENNYGVGKSAGFALNDGSDYFLYCSYTTISDAAKANGGVWLRCVVTDTLLNYSITSNVVAWSTRMTLTYTQNGSYGSVKVEGGLGNHTYEWRGYQGQWYPQSTSASCKMEPSRFSKYCIYVTDEAGFTTYITIDATTGQVIAE